jgi:hypothetical protein
LIFKPINAFGWFKNSFGIHKYDTIIPSSSSSNYVSFTVEPSFNTCLTKCHQTFGCTHITFTYRGFQRYQKGSCWLKNNSIRIESAVYKTFITSAILNQSIILYL